MAVVTYVGKQRKLAKQMTLTINTASTGGTITLTFGNGKTVVITPTTTNTTTTATELLAAIQNASDGEITELTTTSSANVITFVGPDDGAPFDLAKTDGGTNSTTLATTVSPQSPFDAADTLNYSTGALPVDTVDSLVIEDPDVSIKYNTTALAAIELASPGFTRRKSHRGSIGLPRMNPNGYPEYRTGELQIKSATFRIDTGPDSYAEQIRIRSMYTGGAVTVTLQGDRPSTLGRECVEMWGLHTGSVVNVEGSSISLVPYTGQTGAIATLTGTNATIRVGPDATLSGTLNLANCTARIGASWSTSLTLDGGLVEVVNAASGVIVIEGGTIQWLSTGNVGASPVISSGGTLDFSRAPSTLTPGGTMQLYAGSSVIDPNGKSGNFAFKLNHCTLGEVLVVLKNDKTLTLS